MAVPLGLYVSIRRLYHNTLLSDLMVLLIRYAEKTEDAEGVTVGKRSDMSHMSEL